MLVKTNGLPIKLKEFIQTKTSSQVVDVWWSNGCNEEGEEYSELYIDDGETLETVFSTNTWGEIYNLEEALEELEYKC
ncbi:hypothetical protein D3C73_1310940 [compost metagenome]